MYIMSLYKTVDMLCDYYTLIVSIVFLDAYKK